MTPEKMIDAYICYLAETHYGLSRWAGMELKPIQDKLRNAIDDQQIKDFVIWLMDDEE